MPLPNGYAVHGGSPLLIWLRLIDLQFSQILGRQPYLIVRKILYVVCDRGPSKTRPSALSGSSNRARGRYRCPAPAPPRDFFTILLADRSKAISLQQQSTPIGMVRVAT